MKTSRNKPIRAAKITAKTATVKTTRAKIKPLTAETEARKTASKFAFFSEDDPDGSYTGVPENIYEKPIQDVDDL